MPINLILHHKKGGGDFIGLYPEYLTKISHFLYCKISQLNSLIDLNLSLPFL